MKGITLMLALVIFSSSVKATAFVSGLVGAVQGEMSINSCCKSSDKSGTKDCSDSQQEEEESDCCEGSNCDCTCCLHIAYLLQLSNITFQNNDFSESKFGYSFSYHADFLTSVFHPPSLV